MNGPSNDDLKRIGIDLDDTMALNTGYPEFELLDPIADLRESLEIMNERGYRPSVYTARGDADVYKIEQWLIQHHMEHLIRHVHTGKKLFRHLFDDRAIRHTTWKENMATLQELDKDTHFWK